MSEELNQEFKEMKPLIFETMLKIVSGQIPVKSIEFKVNAGLPKSDAEKQLSDLKAKLKEMGEHIDKFYFGLSAQGMFRRLFGTETEVKDE